MQLTYRGIPYSRQNPSIEVIQTAYEGRFLGSRYRITSVKGNTPQRPSQQLSYRLVKYAT